VEGPKGKGRKRGAAGGAGGAGGQEREPAALQRAVPEPDARGTLQHLRTLQEAHGGWGEERGVDKWGGSVEGSAGGDMR
jgi:hypothetical protein